jgi:hypothetical protein
MLRTVARTHGHLCTQHKGNVAVATEHVPRFADLVKNLIGRHPHEIGIHELNHGTEPSVERHAAAQPDECVFADRRAEYALREALAQTARRAVGAAFQAMHILAHYYNALVSSHPASHHIGHHINELARRKLTLEGGFVVEA